MSKNLSTCFFSFGCDMTTLQMMRKHSNGGVAANVAAMSPLSMVEEFLVSWTMILHRTSGRSASPLSVSTQRVPIGARPVLSQHSCKGTASQTLSWPM